MGYCCLLGCTSGNVTSVTAIITVLCFHMKSTCFDVRQLVPNIILQRGLTVPESRKWEAFVSIFS